MVFSIELNAWSHCSNCFSVAVLFCSCVRVPSYPLFALSLLRVFFNVSPSLFSCVCSSWSSVFLFSSFVLFVFLVLLLVVLLLLRVLSILLVFLSYVCFPCFFALVTPFSFLFIMLSCFFSTFVLSDLPVLCSLFSFSSLFLFFPFPFSFSVAGSSKHLTLLSLSHLRSP